MKILLYSELLDSISKSGLGKSIKHQMKALDLVGIDYTLDPEDSFDVVHINTYFPKSFLLARKCRKQGIPIVYHAHSTKEDFQNSFVFSNQLAPLFKQWLITCYKQGDILVTPTPYSKKLLQTYNIDREIVPLSNGIDLNRFETIPDAYRTLREQYELPQDAFVVMGIGLYLERKGILDFIELAKRMPEYQFLWFGYTDPKLIPEKIRLAIKTKVKNLHFAGYVENTEIITALQGCDVFTFTTFEETEGIPAIEACAAKANFIVRDIPVFDGWLIDKENVYKAKDVDHFERLINGFYNKELPNLTENAYQVAVERDLHNIGNQLHAIYEKAIELQSKH